MRFPRRHTARNCRPLCTGILIGAALVLMGSGQLFAETIIVDVTKTGGNAEVPNILAGGLAEGVEAFTDRTHVLVNIPAGLVGADLVQLSNSDKTSVPLEHEVTFDRPVSALYVGLDDRLTAQPLAWMNDTVATGLPTVFFDTTKNVDIDEGNDGSIDQTFSLWVTIAPAGTYSLFEQDDGGSRNMYIVIGSDTLVVPEPATLAMMAALGMLGVLALFWKRRKRAG